MRPWKVAVYVDDFILAVLSCFGLKFIRQVAWATLFGIHAIFPPPSLSGHPGGKDPISTKKLKRGDARLSTWKEILGFAADDRRCTWQLPQTKLQPILQTIRALTKSRCIAKKKFQHIVGKLINATCIAPATKALLTPLFQAMTRCNDQVKLPITPFLRETLSDLLHLLQSLALRNYK